MAHTQGPNRQSIEASGMTVEEWQAKHPNQDLGPDPEEIGQETTDPSDPDGPHSARRTLGVMNLTSDVAHVNAEVDEEGNPVEPAAPKKSKAKKAEVDI